MRVAAVKDLHADFGWRDASFLKITTSSGIVGWAEYTEGRDNPGVSAVIRALGELIVGKDPREVERIAQDLVARVMLGRGATSLQAIGAITNALLDIKAKDLGVPVWSLFGGRVRDDCPVYWSHCGSYRIAHAAHLGRPAPRNRDDIEKLGAEVRERGITALKTNMVRGDGNRYLLFRQGSGNFSDYPELVLDRKAIRATREMLEAFRTGAGENVDILLDINFNFRFDGYRSVINAFDDFGLGWLELDVEDAAELSELRRGSRTPLASGETLYRSEGYWTHLAERSMDIAIVDVVWNGFLESFKVAAIANARSINVAPHNYYGFLADYISASLGALAPNFHSLEIDVDGVPWKTEFVTHPPVIENGRFLFGRRPGWGTDIDENALRRRPPKFQH